jgi:uncharacterized OsmC-like protein
LASPYPLPKIINGVRVDDLFRMADAIRAIPALARFSFRLHNRWTAGPQNSSTVRAFSAAGQEMERARPFVLDTDEPEALLGKDMAASAIEHLLHALAASLTTSIIYHASARRIQIEEIASFLEADVDMRGFLGLDSTSRTARPEIRVHYQIKANVSEEQLRDLCQLGPLHSPVFDWLTGGTTITVDAQRM